MSSFDFEIWLFNPTLTTSPFSKDDKTAGFACSVGNSSYIQSKKQPNQQLNCIEVVQIWAEGCIGNYPIQPWHCFACVFVLPCCSQLG